VPFEYAEYVAMAPRLRTLKGKAITSLNDHPDIRRAFDGFHIETVDIKYTLGRRWPRSSAEGGNHFWLE
jgi:DNA adenine methylase